MRFLLGKKKCFLLKVGLEDALSCLRCVNDSWDEAEQLLGLSEAAEVFLCSERRCCSPAPQTHPDVAAVNIFQAWRLSKSRKTRFLGKLNQNRLFGKRIMEKLGL